VIDSKDFLSFASGNFDIITLEHLYWMKFTAFVDIEIGIAGLEKLVGIKVVYFKLLVDRFLFPDGHGVFVLASGCLLHLGCPTGHPSFVVSCSSFLVLTGTDGSGEIDSKDVLSSATANFDTITLEHLNWMKYNAIVDIEIGMAGLEKPVGVKVVYVKLQVDRFILPDGHGVAELASGCLLNLGCPSGHLSFVVSCPSFLVPTLFVISKNWMETKAYMNDMYLLSKELDDTVACLHLPSLGAVLTESSLS